jgi:single-strand DNA-binding protein
MNVVVLSGNLCNDGELKIIGGGDAVLKLRLAVNESFKTRDGVRTERSDYFSCEIWGKRAEALAPHMSKGTGVIVQGRLRMEKVGENANAKYYTTVRVSEIAFAGGSGEQRQRSIVPETKDAREPPAAPPIDGGTDDIPF